MRKKFFFYILGIVSPCLIIAQGGNPGPFYAPGFSLAGMQQVLIILWK